MLNGTIADLIPIELYPLTAVAATTIAYDMKVEIFTPENVQAFQSNSERLHFYVKGRKY